MNERIKELARQSTGAGTLYMLDDEYLKFAELIVRECAEVAVWEQGKGYDVGEKIKEHFGVE